MKSSGPRILIVRLSAGGDCINTIPILTALRQRLPEAFLAWLIEPVFAPLVEGHRDLDELIQVPKGWLKSPRQVWRLRRKLAAYRFEIAIDSQCLTKSAVAAWLSGARRRIGFAGPHGRELSTWLNNERLHHTGHIVDRNLALLGRLGIESAPARFDIPRNSLAEARMAWFQHQARLTSGFAVLNPGAGWDSRLWPTERYAAVARHLGEARQIRSVATWFGAREHQWARAIVAAARGHAVLAPQTTWHELTALVRSALLFVGSDTGPLHLAAAVGAPCVALHGTTRPQDSGPYGAGHIAIQEYYQGGPCRDRRTAENKAMRAIPIERVVRACDQLLDRQAHPSLRDAA